MFKTRNLIWQMPLLVVFSAPLWWDYASLFLTPEKTFVPKLKPAEKSFVMDGISFVQSRGGEAEFFLTADNIKTLKNQTIYDFTTVDAEILDDDDNVVIKGNNAVFDQQQQIITMLGDVQIDSESGKSLKTSAVRYLTKFKKIKSAAELTYTSEDMTITGNSFFYDLNNGNFRVGKRVHFTMF